MKFYKIENPSTQQIFDAIIKNHYVPLDNMRSKAKQILVLLKAHFETDEIFVTFTNVCNAGGCPIFLGECYSMEDLAIEHIPGFFQLTQEEQHQEAELLGAYMQSYESIFNI